jgi:hypothetical protein
MTVLLCMVLVCIGFTMCMGAIATTLPEAVGGGSTGAEEPLR